MQCDWQNVLELTKGKEVAVTRLQIVESGVAIEGEFSLPPLAKLSPDDQVFVAAFVTSHGSIKAMEQLFGISYPTVKARLKRIADQLPALGLAPETTSHDVSSILDGIASGELSVPSALEELKRCSL